MGKLKLYASVFTLGLAISLSSCSNSKNQDSYVIVESEDGVDYIQESEQEDVSDIVQAYTSDNDTIGDTKIGTAAHVVVEDNVEKFNVSDLKIISVYNPLVDDYEIRIAKKTSDSEINKEKISVSCLKPISNFSLKDLSKETVEKSYFSILDNSIIESLAQKMGLDLDNIDYEISLESYEMIDNSSIFSIYLVFINYYGVNGNISEIIMINELDGDIPFAQIVSWASGNNIMKRNLGVSWSLDGKDYYESNLNHRINWESFSSIYNCSNDSIYLKDELLNIQNELNNTIEDKKLVK